MDNASTTSSTIRTYRLRNVEQPSNKRTNDITLACKSSRRTLNNPTFVSVHSHEGVKRQSTLRGMWTCVVLEVTVVVDGEEGEAITQQSPLQEGGTGVAMVIQ